MSEQEVLSTFVADPTLNKRQKACKYDDYTELEFCIP